MPGILVIHREQDADAQAKGLLKLLRARLPGRPLLKGVDAAEQSSVVVAVIGPNWLTAASERDLMQQELATALHQGIRIILALVNGAERPRKEDLPSELAGLAEARAFALRDAFWDSDVRPLIAALGDAPLTRPTRRTVILAGGSMALVGGMTVAKLLAPGKHRQIGLAPLGRKQTVRKIEPALTIPVLAAVHAIAAVPGGGLLSASFEGIKLWDLTSKAARTVFHATDDDPLSLLPLPDGRWTWGSRDGHVKVWDDRTRHLDWILPGHDGAVVALAMTESGLLASGSWDSTVKLWDLATGKLVKTLTRHTGQVLALAALPGNRLVSGSADGSMIVWDLSAETEKTVAMSDGAAVSALAALPDRRIAAATGKLEIWNVATGAVEQRNKFHDDWVNVLVPMPGGRLACASDNRLIAIWNVAANRLEAVLTGHVNKVTALALLADGRLASGGIDRTIRVWAL